MASFKHHGIKGQKWGVRNGPPYPIEDKVLKKGTRLNSVSSVYTDSDKYRKSGRAIYTYRKDEEWDNKVYKGPFSAMLYYFRNANFIAEHSYETTKDLRMPTSTERKQILYDMLNDKKTSKVTKKDLNFYKKFYLEKHPDTTMAKIVKDLDIDNIKTEDDKNRAYQLFGRVLGESEHNKSAQIYLKKIKKDYDAMVDDNNVNKYNDAHDPIIVFRGDLFLKSIPEDKKYLTIDELNSNIEYVEKELEKQGKYMILA